MRTRRFIIELTYDNITMYGENPDQEELDWFKNDVLKHPDNLLFNPEIGDDVGTIKIISEITFQGNILVNNLE